MNQALDGVGEQGLLHAFVGDAEHHHVVESLTGFRIDGVGAPIALASIQLAADAKCRPAVGGSLERRLRQGAGDRLDVLTGQHSPSVARRSFSGGGAGLGSAAWFCGVTWTETVHFTPQNGC